jgi:tRNA(fMet)-specific endonuclease VapC
MKAEPQALQRLQACAKARVTIPQPVVAEISFGLARLPDSRRKALLAESFQAISHALRRSPWTDDVSREFGRIKALLFSQGEPLEDFDIAIGCHALAVAAVLVTDNTRHLARIPGLQIETWG